MIFYSQISFSLKSNCAIPLSEQELLHLGNLKARQSGEFEFIWVQEFRSSENIYYKPKAIMMNRSGPCIQKEKKL
ncbi:hypothetical protein BSQ33_07400 [Vibrio gazogenes]|uniref:Uncharacterized protein n=1 Tax=Vibrio gazogenes TaxID=687 RepID=A0A1Z2SEE6_VIBGA|nr:hypothetical protein BSQ33_07400 [Vibrio gazogenes]